MAPIDLRSNQPLLVIILANGFIGASLGMIIFTSAIRSIPEHLFHAARADGAGSLAIVRHIVFPALRWPISYMTIHQTLSLLVSFEYILLITGGRPVLRHDGVLALRLPARVRERPVRVRRRALAHPHRDRRDRGARHVAADGHAAAAAAAADRGALMTPDTPLRRCVAAARPDWPVLARRARLKRVAGQSALLAFLLLGLAADHPAVFLDGRDLVHGAQRRRGDRRALDRLRA